MMIVKKHTHTEVGKKKEIEQKRQRKNGDTNRMTVTVILAVASTGIDRNI